MTSKTETREDILRMLLANPSTSKRLQTLEILDSLEGAEHFEAAMTLFETPYPDLWEAVLETCTAERVSAPDWRQAFLNWVGAEHGSVSDRVRVAAVICIRRLTEPVEDGFMAYSRSALDDANDEVRYQAACLAEIREASGEEYLERVKQWLDTGDEDFRIIGIQATRRLKPEWGPEALASLESRATGEELFQVLLAEMDLISDEGERERVGRRVLDLVYDGRFSFAAIQALSRHKMTFAVPELEKLAKRFFVDPTVRVAAAGAAANMGSEEGRKLLVKFAVSGSGNPDYAEELLTALKHGEFKI